MYYQEMIEEAERGNLIVEEISMGNRTRQRWDSKTEKYKKMICELHYRCCRTKDMSPNENYKISKSAYLKLKRIIDKL